MNKKSRCAKTNTCCTITVVFTYSVLRLFTGLAIAAFIAWKLIVMIVITIATNVDIRNTPAPMLM